MKTTYINKLPFIVSCTIAILYYTNAFTQEATYAVCYDVLNNTSCLNCTISSQDSFGLYRISKSNIFDNSDFIIKWNQDFYFINMKRSLYDIQNEFYYLILSFKFNNDSIIAKCIASINYTHKFNFYFDNGTQRTIYPKYDPQYWCIDSVKNKEVLLYDWSKEFE